MNADEQHPDEERFAWRLGNPDWGEDDGEIFERTDVEPRSTDTYVGEFVSVSDAALVVDGWNDSHSVPGAPLVGDAGEVSAFLDEKPGDE